MLEKDNFLKADDGYNAWDVWVYKEIEETNSLAKVEVIPGPIAVI